MMQWDCQIPGKKGVLYLDYRLITVLAPSMLINYNLLYLLLDFVGTGPISPEDVLQR